MRMMTRLLPLLFMVLLLGVLVQHERTVVKPQPQRQPTNRRQRFTGDRIVMPGDDTISYADALAQDFTPEELGAIGQRERQQARQHVYDRYARFCGMVTS